MGFTGDEILPIFMGLLLWDCYVITGAIYSVVYV